MVSESDQIFPHGEHDAEDIRNLLQSGISKQILQRIGFNPNKFTPSRLTFSTSHSGSIQSQVNTMKQHLQAAVSLELTTIPLYLYAAYSIKEPKEAIWSIKS